MSENIKCPYCDNEFDYEDTDVEQDETLTIECPGCEKLFTAVAVWTLDFMHIEKAQCLNGGAHILKQSIGIPDGFPKQYRCQICDHHGSFEAFKYRGRCTP